MAKIGDKIAQLRKEKDLSQTDLAKRINASREAIDKYERNESIPSVEMARKVADVFEVTLDYIVGEGKNARFDKKTLKRLEDISNLPDKDKEYILYTLDGLLRDAKTRQAYANK